MGLLDSENQHLANVRKLVADYGDRLSEEIIWEVYREVWDRDEFRNARIKDHIPVLVLSEAKRVLVKKIMELGSPAGK